MNRVAAAADKARKRIFAIMGFAIRKTAVGSIEQEHGPSDPGEPPHTHRRAFLRRAVLYAANKDGVVIGPRMSVVGISGMAHEFGGKYGKGVYPERPFMRPAMEQNLSRFANEWNAAFARVIAGRLERV